MRLEGKIALVTGAASGIGRQTAITFAREGAQVFLCDINEEGLQQVKAEIEAGGGRATALKLDVTDEENWSEDFLFNLEYIRYAQRFAALDAPVYYYVKNRTSITNSQIDLISVVKTKTTLFPYYKALYEQLGLYEKYRPQIYKYLIATASRGQR